MSNKIPKQGNANASKQAPIVEQFEEQEEQFEQEEQEEEEQTPNSAVEYTGNVNPELLYKNITCKVLFMKIKDGVKLDGTNRTQFQYRLMSLPQGISNADLHLYGRVENGGRNIFYSSTLKGHDKVDEKGNFVAFDVDMVFSPDNKGRLTAKFAKSGDKAKRLANLAKKQERALFAQTHDISAEHLDKIELKHAEKLLESMFNMEF